MRRTEWGIAGGIYVTAFSGAAVLLIGLTQGLVTIPTP